MNWYFSDPHWGHINMARHRGFSSVEEMDDVIVEGLNSKCTKRDDLYCMGDAFWVGKPEEIKAFLKRLNFKRLFFIRGNHDKPLQRFMKQTKDSRLSLQTDMFIKDSGYSLHLYHYPVLDWEVKFNNDFSIHLHGHQHANSNAEMMTLKNAYNVNVDLNDYKPLNIEEILEKMKVNLSPCCQYSMTHMYDTPHGLRRGYMKGSERYCCLSCGRSFHKEKGEQYGLKYHLER